MTEVSSAVTVPREALEIILHAWRYYDQQENRSATHVRCVCELKPPLPCSLHGSARTLQDTLDRSKEANVTVIDCTPACTAAAEHTPALAGCIMSPAQVTHKRDSDASTGMERIGYIIVDRHAGEWGTFLDPGVYDDVDDAEEEFANLREQGYRDIALCVLVPVKQS